MSHLDNSTILVTGASGFIGQHLIERLSAIKGVRLVLLSREPRESGRAQVTWVVGSLNDLSDDFWQGAGISKIDVVFHLGAFTPKVKNDANSVERIFADNLLGTQTLLAGLPSEVRTIVFASTIDVYAPPISNEVLTERSRLEPSSLYGASKLFCERLVSVWAEERGCQYVILRYGHIFGPGEEAYGKLVPLIIRQLLAGKAPTVYGGGLAERDLLYVQDAVEATIRAAQAADNVGPVNIVRGESCAIRDIVQTLVEKSGSPARINYLRDKPDGHSLRFDVSMMRKVLGKWPLVSLEDGLSEEIIAFKRLSDGQ